MGIRSEINRAAFAELPAPIARRIRPSYGYKLHGPRRAARVRFGIEWDPRMRPTVGPWVIYRPLARLRASLVDRVCVGVIVNSAIDRIYRYRAPQ